MSFSDEFDDAFLLDGVKEGLFAGEFIRFQRREVAPGAYFIQSGDSIRQRAAYFVAGFGVHEEYICQAHDRPGEIPF